MAILDVEDPFKPKNTALDIEDPFKPRTPITAPDATAVLPEPPTGAASAATPTPKQKWFNPVLPEADVAPVEPPASAVDTALALPKGAYHGVTRGLPEMAGKAIEFAGSHLPVPEEAPAVRTTDVLPTAPKQPEPTNAVQKFGKAVSEFNLSPANFGRMSAEELAAEKQADEHRKGLESVLYQVGDMLGPSVIPGVVAGTAARAILGVGKLAKAARAAELAGDLAGRELYISRANHLADLANKAGGIGAAALFGGQQAQQTIDSTNEQVAKLESEGKHDEAQALKNSLWTKAAPYLTGAIEAAGEYFGTQYLGKLFGLDEAEALQKIAKKSKMELAKDLLKTMGVEVGTEVGQQGLEAGTEKLAGIRPEADVLGETASVILPTIGLTLLTGGLAHGSAKIAEKLSRGEKIEPTPKEQEHIKETINKVTKENPEVFKDYTPDQIYQAIVRPNPVHEATGAEALKESIAQDRTAVMPEAGGFGYAEKARQARELSTFGKNVSPIDVLPTQESETAPNAVMPTATAPEMPKSVLPTQEVAPKSAMPQDMGQVAPTLPPVEAKAPETTVTMPGQNLPEKAAQEIKSALPHIDQQAHEAATSPLNVLPQPTKPQIEAGNAKLGHVKVAGMDISVENPSGSVREDKKNTPPKWQTEMKYAHYGYIRNTKSNKDGKLDVFLRPGTQSEHEGPVYLINQVDPKTGKFDEVKTMIGYGSQKEARKSYLANYEPGWQGIGSIVEMSTPEFKTWIKEGDTTKEVKAAKKVNADLASLPARSETFDTEDRRSPDRKVWDSYDAAIAEGDTEKAKQIATKLAYLDKLTGLIRREGWQHDEAEGKHDQYSQRFFMDLDNFHDVNSVLTHEGGDQVLAFFGKLIRFHLDGGAAAARWGGDEFVGAGSEDLESKLKALQTDAESIIIPIDLKAGMEYPKGSGKILTAPLHLEQEGIRLSFGIGKTYAEAYNANTRSKDERKESGLRHERTDVGPVGKESAEGREVREAVPAEPKSVVTPQYRGTPLPEHISPTIAATPAAVLPVQETPAVPEKAGGTPEKVVPRGTSAQVLPEAVTELAPGASVRVGKSPQVHTVIRAIEATANEKALGERYYEVRNNKSGEIETLEAKDLSLVKKPAAEKPAPKEEPKKQEVTRSLKTFVEAGNETITNEELKGLYEVKKGSLSVDQARAAFERMVKERKAAVQKEKEAKHDRENAEGVSGKEQGRQEPEQAEPVKRGSEKTAERSGSVQAHGEVTARDERRHIALGDLHGEHDSFMIHMEHAGLVKKGKWVGGNTVVVQVGDVIDRGPMSRQLFDTLLELQSQARKAGGHIKLLLGNHELMVLQGNLYYAQEAFSKPDLAEYADDLREAVKSGKVQAAYVQNGRVYTHAGIGEELFKIITESVGDNPQVIADYLNTTLVDAVKRNDFHNPIFNVSRNRGGNDEFAGVFWQDWNEFNPPSGLQQVVGHTPQRKGQHARKGDAVNIDIGLHVGYGGNKGYFEAGKDIKQVDLSQSPQKGEPHGEETRSNAVEGNAEENGEKAKALLIPFEDWRIQGQWLRHSQPKGKLTKENGDYLVTLLAKNGIKATFVPQRGMVRIDSGKEKVAALWERYGSEAKKKAALPQKESAETATPSPEAGAAKEPWMMTANEYKKASKADVDFPVNGITEDVATKALNFLKRNRIPKGMTAKDYLMVIQEREAWNLSEWQDAIRKAWVYRADETGKPVPESILKEYGLEKKAETKEPWEMNKKEFRSFIESQADVHNPRKRPVSFGDYSIPQNIEIDGREYRFWHSSHKLKGHSMAMSNEVYVTGPNIPAGTKKTASGSMENADATFILRAIRKAEVEQAAKKGKFGEGIKDYPDLVEKYGKKEARAPENGGADKRLWEVSREEFDKRVEARGEQKNALSPGVHKYNIFEDGKYITVQVGATPKEALDYSRYSTLRSAVRDGEMLPDAVMREYRELQNRFEAEKAKAEEPARPVDLTNFTDNPVRVLDVYGHYHYVDKGELEGTKNILRKYKANGERIQEEDNRNIHRGNIVDQNDAEAVVKAKKAARLNTLEKKDQKGELTAKEVEEGKQLMQEAYGKGKLTDEQIATVAVRQQEETPQEVVKDAVKAAPETTAKALKEQKKFLIEHIDEAIKEAPDTIDGIESKIRSINKLKADAEKAYKNASELRSRKKDEAEVQASLNQYEALKKRAATIQKSIPSVTIEVPNDGNFTVYNDKQTLKKFKEIVAKQFPTTVEKEKGAPHLPTEKARGYRAPREFADGIAVTYNGKPAYTDGHIVLMGESKVVPEKPAKRWDDRKPSEESVKQIFDSSKNYARLQVDKIKFVATDKDKSYGVADTPIKGDLQSYTVLMSGDVSAVINTDYYQHIIDQYPDATFKISGNLNNRGENVEPIGIYDKGKQVGVVMPMANAEIANIVREHLNEASATGKTEDIETPVQEEIPTTAPEATEGKKGEERKSQKETSKIQDFGEKIGGARKDYAASFAEAKNLDIATEPFAKTWPEPDYAKMLEQGFSAEDVSLVRALRDEIPDKPRKSWKIKQWVELVKSLRDHAEKLLSGESTVVRSVMEKTKHENQAVQEILNRAELYDTVGHTVSLKGVTLSARTYSRKVGDKWTEIHDWAVEKKAKATAMSNWPRQLGVGDTREEAIADFKSKIGELSEEKSERITKFIVYSKRGEKGFIVGKQFGKNYVDLERFDTAKEAHTYIAENRQKLEDKLAGMKDIPYERGDQNRNRVGADIRGGKDVTPEEFTQAFGFRGVEFGNFVNAQERQQNLNETFDALHDLAEILNIPTRAISLNGELGLAFGARGHGGKRAPSAHYEPDRIVINLTKKHGAGSLAHEWFHGLDNYLSRQRGKKEGYITETPIKHGPQDQTRQELVDAFKKLKTVLDGTNLKDRSLKLDQLRTKAYWSTGIEMHARAFENYVIDKLTDGAKSNDYLANIKSIHAYAEELLKGLLSGMKVSDIYPYLMDDEKAKVSQAFDNLFTTIKNKETEKGVALYSSKESSTLPSLITKWESHGVQIDAFDHRENTKIPGNILAINRIVVDQSKRKHGLGTMAMLDLVDFADENGLRIELSPDKALGATSVSRLKEFYKRFGFVENKGRNRDLRMSATMYREPVEVAYAAKEEPAPTFYSQLERTVTQSLPESVKAEGLLAFLKRFKFKKDDLLHSGIATVDEKGNISLDPEVTAMEKNGRIRKADLMALIGEKSANIVPVEFSDKSTDERGIVEAWWNDEGGANEETPFSELSDAEKQSAIDRYHDEVGKYEEESSSPQFSNWKIPGESIPGSYVEHFETVPGETTHTPDQDAEYKRLQDKNYQLADEKKEIDRLIDYDHPEKWTAKDRANVEKSNDLSSLRAAIQNKIVLMETEIYGKTWHDGHQPYESVKNPIVRWRGDGRTDVDGNRVFFIHEIQAPNPENQAKMPEWSRKRWREIGLKSALGYAIKNGYQRLALATGEQVAGLYDLSKQVDEITIGRNDGGYWFKAFKNDNEVTHNAGINESQLAEFVGKDLANKAVHQMAEWGNSDNPARTLVGQTYSANDLKVGGEGIKKLYDRDLPSILSDMGKKFGVKVSNSSILTDKGAKGIVWDGVEQPGRAGLIDTVKSIEITPSMRESVLSEGQPLYSLSSDDIAKIDRAFPETMTKEKALYFLDNMVKFGTIKAESMESSLARSWVTDHSGETIRKADLLAFLRGDNVSRQSGQTSAVQLRSAKLEPGKNQAAVARLENAINGNRHGQARVRILEVAPPDGVDAHDLGSFAESAFGLNVVYIKTIGGPALNGVTVDGNTIFIDVLTEEPHLAIFWHELVHTLRLNHRGLYDDLVANIAQYEQGFKDYKKNLDLSMARSGMEASSHERAVEEFIADFVGNRSQYEPFMRQLAAKNTTVFQRFVAVLKRFIMRIKRRFTGEFQGNIERYFSDIDAALEGATDILAEYARFRQGFKPENQPGQMRYSFGGQKDKNLSASRERANMAPMTPEKGAGENKPTEKNPVTPGSGEPVIGNKLPKGWVYHNTKSSDLSIIEREGLQGGSFTEKPGFDFGGDSWIAVRESDLRNTQRHQYGDIESIEPQWGPGIGGEGFHTIPASRVVEVDRKGIVKRVLSESTSDYPRSPEQGGQVAKYSVVRKDYSEKRGDTGPFHKAWVVQNNETGSKGTKIFTSESAANAEALRMNESARSTPSNLNPFQQAQVRTPEFRAWFKGSKVVDENGEPRILYHSTMAKEDFTKFKNQRHDIGIHLGTIDQANDRYDLKRENIGDDPHMLKSGPDRVIPVFASIQNPLRLDDLGAWTADNMFYALADKPQFHLVDGPLDTLANIRKTLQDSGYDGIVYKNTGEVGGASELRKKMDDAWDAVWMKYGKSSFTPEEQKDPLVRAHSKAMEEYRDFREKNGEDSYIVFNPRQIKSATGNTGSFSAKNPDIRYSLKPRGAKAAAEAQSDLTPFSGKAESNQFVSTMKILGERPKEFFGVYKNAFEHDDLGSLGRIFNLPHWIAKQYEDFNRVMDVEEVRQENRDELRHKLLAAALKKNAGQMHEFLALDRDAKKRVEKYLLQSDQENRVMRPEELTDLSTDEKSAYYSWKTSMDAALELRMQWLEKMNLLPYEKKSWYPALKLVLAVKGAKNRNEALETALIKYVDPKQELSFRDAYKNVVYGRTEIARLRRQIGRIKFYVPHQREGKYVVEVFDPSVKAPADYKGQYYDTRLKKVVELPWRGKLLWAERFENKAAGTEAILRLRDKFRGMDIVDRVDERTPEEIYQTLNDAAVAKFVEDAMRHMEGKEDVPADTLMGLRNSLMQTVVDDLRGRGWERHSIKRRPDWVGGYQTQNLDKVFVDYMGGLAGSLTKMEAAYHYAEALGQIDPKKKELYAYAQNYVRNLTRNQTALDRKVGKLKAAAFTWFITGKLSMVPVQLTQNFITGIPQLGRYTQNPARKYGLAMANVATEAAISRLSAVEQKALQDFHNKGLDQAKFIDEIMGRTEGALKGSLATAQKWLSWAFYAAEKFNRKSAFLAAYRIFENKSKIGEKGYDEQAFNRARDFVNDTHFLMGRANKPELAAGDTPGSAAINLMYTFNSFSHNYALGIYDAFKTGGAREGGLVLLRSLAWLSVFGGMAAIPWWDDFMDELEKLFGVPARQKMRASLRAVGGQTLEAMGMHGLPAVLGADLSGSLKTGIPFKEGVSDTALGVYGGLLEKVVRATKSFNRGDIMRGIEQGSPLFVENVLKAWRMWDTAATTPSGRTIFTTGGKPLKLNAWETAIQAAGIRPERVSESSGLRQEARNITAYFKDRKARIYDQYALAKTAEEKRAVLKEVRKFNRDVIDKRLRSVVSLINTSTLRTSLIARRRPDKKLTAFENMT